MQLAFALYKYFPFGGLQRDFLAVAYECHKRGHSVSAYVLEWHDDIPEWLKVVIVPVKAWASHRRYTRYSSWLHQHKVFEVNDIVIGFNKMPELDIYFAADPCYAEKVSSRGFLYRNSARCKHFIAHESSVFSPESKTEILTIARNQGGIFRKYYDTQESRIHMLPPGIDAEYKDVSQRQALRDGFRKEYGLADDETLLLLVGSGFKTKGLDRALIALASLPKEILEKTYFYVVGKDKPSRFLSQAKSLGVSRNLKIFTGRDDVRRFMFGADLMLHPAYFESAGKVLIESIASGLPVLVTEACGYAHYINDADAGCVLENPFSQEGLNQLLLSMLQNVEGKEWSSNGVKFAQRENLYSQAQCVVDLIESFRRGRG